MAAVGGAVDVVESLRSACGVDIFVDVDSAVVVVVVGIAGVGVVGIEAAAVVVASVGVFIIKM